MFFIVLFFVVEFIISIVAVCIGVSLVINFFANKNVEKNYKAHRDINKYSVNENGEEVELAEVEGICSFCGEKISPFAKVCPKCGQSDPAGTYKISRDVEKSGARILVILIISLTIIVTFALRSYFMSGAFRFY